MTNVLQFPRLQKHTKKVKVDVFDIVIQQTYPNPIIYDLFWIMKLICSNRDDVIGVDTWFEDGDDNICYFELRLNHHASIVTRCVGVEETNTYSTNLSFMNYRYVPKDNSCFESVKLQVFLADTHCNWTDNGSEATFTFPERKTEITVIYKNK